MRKSSAVRSSLLSRPGLIYELDVQFSGLLIAFVYDAGFGNGVFEAMSLSKKLSVWQIESSLMQNTI